MRPETEYAFVFVVVMAGLNLLRLACNVRGREISRGSFIPPLARCTRVVCIAAFIIGVLEGIIQGLLEEDRNIPCSV